MSFVMVDIESDGPIPGDYSMVSFGAVIVEPALARTFYGRVRPISGKWIPEALAVSGHTRDETLQFAPAEQVMADFRDWRARTSKGSHASSPTTTASTGSSSTGISITSSAPTPLVFPPRTSARFTKAR